MSIAIRCRAALAFAVPCVVCVNLQELEKAHAVSVPFVVFGNALSGPDLRLTRI
jgi:hypothetical protein